MLRDLIRMDAVVSLMAIGGHHHTDADEEFVVTPLALKQQAAKHHCGGKKHLDMQVTLTIVVMSLH